MVFFSCDGCGEMVKKNQVDTHANKCRRCDSVSCVDCSVSFYGDDYRQHTSCISEAERYEKSVYKGGKNGKKSPQEAWMDLISRSSATAPPPVRFYMEQLANLDNVPRKQKQFRNFTANSLTLRSNNSQSIVDEMWKHLSQEREKELEKKKETEERQAKEKEKNEQTKKSETKRHPCPELSLDGEKEKIRELSEESGRADTTCPILTPKLIKKTMKKILKKAPKRAMKLKLLKKAVSEKLGADRNARKLLKKLLTEQVSANHDEIQVNGKLITLCERNNDVN